MASMVILISLLASLPVEAGLVLWTGHMALEWSASAGSCEIAPSSMNLKYCGSFWSVVAPWVAASLVIPVGWLFAILRRPNR